MDAREQKAEQVRARRARMEEPRLSRRGTISTGTKVCYCKGDGKCGPIPTFEIKQAGRCPRCGGPVGNETVGKLNYFRFVGFAPDQEEILKKLYGPKPTVIPFTFPGHPARYIEVGRECYQGQFLHCCNHWQWDHREQLFVDSGNASRRVEDTMQRKEMPCHPDRCPFVIGTADGSIKQNQCGEIVVANLWLYQLDGWDLVRFKSGGINTINNFQDAIRKMLVLMAGSLKSLKLELRIRSKPTKYPTATGFKSTTINEVYIHWPNNPEAMAKQLAAGDLKETDVYVALPQLGKTRLAIPDKGSEPENTFDELVDGPRQMPVEEKPVEKLNISDLPGREEPMPVQAVEKISEDNLATIQNLLREIVPATADEKQYKNERARILKAAKGAVGYQGNFFSLPESKAGQFIDWLKRHKAEVIMKNIEGEKIAKKQTGDIDEDMKAIDDAMRDSTDDTGSE